MKKLIITLVIFSILFLLDRVFIGGSFTELVLGAPDRTLHRIIHSKQQIDSSKLSEEECALKGGRWAKWGLAQRQYCQIPSSDAGKTCFSGFQCQYGSCIDESYKPSAIGLGICKIYQNAFGCYSQRHFGIGRQAICVD